MKLPVMWSETISEMTYTVSSGTGTLNSTIPYHTIGLRTRPVWDQKIGLGLGLKNLVLFTSPETAKFAQTNRQEYKVQ